MPTVIHADHVTAAARNKGMKKLSRIKYAILERQGAISIIKKEE